MIISDIRSIALCHKPARSVRVVLTKAVCIEIIDMFGKMWTYAISGTALYASGIFCYAKYMIS